MPSFEEIRAAILNNPAAMQMLNGISSRLREERQSGYRRALNQQIDRSQQAFIESDAKKIRLIAPAGAGKTMTIVNRVLYRGSQGVPLQRCLLLTFDRSAQNSLQSRFDHTTIRVIAVHLSSRRSNLSMMLSIASVFVSMNPRNARRQWGCATCRLSPQSALLWGTLVRDLIRASRCVGRDKSPPTERY
jgi:hypothetical protein